ncbi:MAG TPA: chemotaxis protein CheB [Verrucomicrobiae bacterium]|nr:chemotaxis protein CheB [Verrucomicrobiae bacterium]
MAKRASKTQKKSPASPLQRRDRKRALPPLHSGQHKGAAPKTKGQARQALRKMAALHRTADALHKKSESLHVAAHAARQRVRSMGGAGLQPKGGAPVKDLPPSGRPKDRIEPVKELGAPGTGELDIVALHPPALPFSVVGIGASAGGFEAALTLVSNLPKDLRMALVIIPHLDPSHESRLADLLAHKSAMPVVSISSGVPVEPGNIYVLPANAAVILEGTRLALRNRETRTVPMPIDVFFRSLAVAQQNRAIGIVLSGTGTDGTLGLEEIKGQGGLTFAQDKGSAKHFGMPGSAIAAGVVDFVLAPDSFARELVRLAEHPYVAPDGKSVAQLPPAEHTFKEYADEMKALLSLLRTRTGVDFSLYKAGTLNRRILRRMVLHTVDELPDYVKIVQGQPAEAEALFNDLLISVTGFFRDSGFYDVLKKKILPRLLKNRPEDAPLRVWSCGCATGEEAYSLAIVIAEHLDEIQNRIPIQIFASDINEKGIEKARTGLYHENILIDVSPERLRRFFVKVDSFYQVSRQIRDMCTFARQNVAVDPPFSNLDVISCRNVLIYLTPVLQRRIMPIFHYALKPGGYMLLGSSETSGDSSELFELADKKNKIYIKKTTAYRPAFIDVDRGFVPPRVATPPAPRTPPAAGRERIVPVDYSLQQRVDRFIASEYAPTAVVISEQMDVLQFRGRTAPFIEHQAGAASLNLLKIVREDLVLDVRRAVNKAIRSGENVRVTGEMRVGSHLREVRIEARPLPEIAASETFYIVTFREISVAETEATVAPTRRQKIARDKLEERQLTKLRQELAATKESLQAIIEEQDATNEELKSANEEIQSSNEELQSTNEELETAREELQSTNEELTTLNQELQSRNAELGQVNNDLSNLLASVNIAIIMLGTDFKIRRFTPTAEKIFNLIPSDVGRKLSDLSRNIHVPDLNEAIDEVIDRLTVIEREVQDKEGRWYSLRIRPYRTRESHIDGVVLILLDIDELKRAIKHIISLPREPLLALTADLKVSAANDAFCRAFQVAPENIERKSVYEMADGAWNIPRLKQLLEDFLAAQGEVRDFRLEHDFQGLGKRKLLINARRFYEESRGLQLILLAIEDLT